MPRSNSEGRRLGGDHDHSGGGEGGSKLRPHGIVTRFGRGEFNLPPHHTTYNSGVNNKEIFRIPLEPDEKLVVKRLGYRMKGGGTTQDIDIDVYDVTNGERLVQTTDLKVAGETPLAESQTGATIIGRITNATASAQDLSLTGLFAIVEA